MNAMNPSDQAAIDKKAEKLHTIRHSLSHIMAEAVRSLFPNVKFGIGPAIDNGFYYDFDISNLGAEDLPKIEAKMRELIKSGLTFKRETITKEAALELFKDQPYKIELVQDLTNVDITTYTSGSFVDLCAGPHIASSKEIPMDGFKLDRIAGAYWRGSEKNPMLQRIYGLAFLNRKDLDAY